MKKILICVLMLAVLVTAFVSCKEEEPDLTGLANAKEYLSTQLKDAPVSTGADYTRAAALRNDLGTYTVTWTVNVTEGPANGVSVGEAVDGLVTINVDEFASAKVVYTLTATITDANGYTETLVFNHEVPAFALNTYEEYVAACDANDKETIITVKGYVVGVNADSGSSSKASLWITDANGKGYYAYKPTLDTTITESRDTINAAFPRGKEVVVKGTVSNYNGCLEFNAGCEIISTGNSVDPATLAYVDVTELFTNANGITDFETLSATQATRVTVKNITMGVIDGNNYHYTIGENDGIFYMNIYLLSTEEQDALKAKWVEGGKANLSGIVNVYSGKHQIYPDTVNSIEIVEENLTDAQKVARQKGLLELEESYAANFTLPAGTWANVAWAVTGEGAVIGEAGAVTITQAAAIQTVTFTATITAGEATDTKEFTVTIPALVVEDPNADDIILNIANLGVGGSYGDGTATLRGVNFSWVELGDYGFGMQMRQKEGKISSIANTSAFNSGLKSIVIKLNEGKSVYDNTGVFSFKFGTAADALAGEILVDTVANQYEYTVTPDVETYTFFSVTKAIASYTFYVDSITLVFGDGLDAAPETPADPETPAEPVACPLVVGTGYTISAANANGTIYFAGTVTSKRFDATLTAADAAVVYIEAAATAGNYYLYMTDGTTKTYICMDDASTGASLSTDVATATIYEWNAEKNTLAVADDDNNRAFGAGATSTYNNFSCYDLKGDYNWGTFTAVAAE